MTRAARRSRGDGDLRESRDRLEAPGTVRDSSTGLLTGPSPLWCVLISAAVGVALSVLQFESVGLGQSSDRLLQVVLPKRPQLRLPAASFLREEHPRETLIALVCPSHHRAVLLQSLHNPGYLRPGEIQGLRKVALAKAVALAQ